MKAAAGGMIFADIGPEDPRLATDVLPVLRELRPHLTPQSLKAICIEGHPQGLRFTGAYVLVRAWASPDGGSSPPPSAAAN